LYSPRPKQTTKGDDRFSETTPGIRTFHYGERLHFSAQLKLPRNFRNPGAFDYQGYLADRGIAALGSAKLENVDLLADSRGSRLGDWRSRLHRGAIAKVHEIWPAREAALIDAMVIGEEAFIDRDTRVDFQRSGTYHILVVSGMNVSILAFVVFWTLRRLRLGDISATLLTVSFCIAYAFITEVGAPVWRATLMCGIYLGTRLLYRDRAMVNALGAAALGLLVFDPRQLLDDICVRVHRGSDRNSNPRTYISTLPASARQLGIRRLRRVTPAARGAVPCGLAIYCRTRCAVRRRKLVASPGPRHCAFRPGRVGIAFHLGRHADGTGLAHGVLLPPRHHHRITFQHRRRSS